MVGDYIAVDINMDETVVSKNDSKNVKILTKGLVSSDLI